MAVREEGDLANTNASTVDVINEDISSNMNNGSANNDLRVNNSGGGINLIFPTASRVQDDKKKSSFVISDSFHHIWSDDNDDGTR